MAGARFLRGWRRLADLHGNLGGNDSRPLLHPAEVASRSGQGLEKDRPIRIGRRVAAERPTLNVQRLTLNAQESEVGELFCGARVVP